VGASAAAADRSSSAEMTREQRDALITRQRVADAVIATVNGTPQGAPGDRIYAALSEYLRRDEFETMMRVLVEAERITKRGDRYLPKIP
jgi:hypothetical protein